MEFKNHDTMKDYVLEFLLDNDTSMFISTYETIIAIADEIEEVIGDSDILDKTSNDVENDSIVFIKNYDNGVFIINDVFYGNGDMRELEANYVLIENDLLLDEIIDDYIIAEEELEFIGVEENTNDGDDECRCCERCCKCHCEDEENKQIVINFNVNLPNICSVNEIEEAFKNLKFNPLQYI